MPRLRGYTATGQQPLGCWRAMQPWGAGGPLGSGSWGAGGPLGSSHGGLEGHWAAAPGRLEGQCTGHVPPLESVL